MITTDKEKREDSFLKDQISLLQVTLMWPTYSRSRFKSLIAHVYFFLVCASLAMCTVGLFMKTMISDDLVERSEAIDIFTLTASGLYKIVYFNYNHKTLQEIADYADDVFLKDTPFGQEKVSMIKWMRWTGPLSIAHCLAAFCAITFWGICPILNVLFGVTPLEEMTLPMNVWYPYDYNQTLKFVPLYLVHYFGLIASTHSYMATDGFFFSLIHFSSGQMGILKTSLRQIKNIEPEGRAH